MEEIRKGCALRHKVYSHIKVWVVYADEDDCHGIALIHDDICCDVGDLYTNMQLCYWELTDEFYDVAEIVTKMQKGE